MLCSGTNPIVDIVGVEHMHWAGRSFTTLPRQYAALAFGCRHSPHPARRPGAYSVGTGDVLYMPQKIAYSAEYDDTEILVLHFLTAKDDPEPEVYRVADDGALYKRFMQTHLLWQLKRPGYFPAVMAGIYDILRLLCENSAMVDIPPHFMKAVSYMNAHFTDPDVTIDRICREAGIGATAFRAYFRRYYCKSPIEYLTDLRIDYARNLISGGVSVEVAAAESGFRDPKYFSRVVKKRCGCTPRSFRSYGR